MALNREEGDYAMSGVTKLYLVRHGDTVDEETKKVYKGTIDIALSQTGRDRIAGAARYLSRFSLNHVYSSALSRCSESAAIIAAPHNLPVRALSALNEVHFGLWEGLSFDEISKEYGAEFDAWFADPVKISPPGGETLMEARKRIGRAVKEIVSRHRGQDVALVAHAGVLRIMLCSFLGLRLSVLFRLGQDYGGISIVNIYDDHNAVVRLLNFTDY